jgi:hypothetical protein
MGDIVWLKRDGLEGLNSSSGKVIFPVEYLDIQPVGCGFYRCRKLVNGIPMQAVVNLEGKYIWKWTAE